LDKVFGEHKFEAVIHFAALKAVGESVRKPLEYYRNNIMSTLALCDVMAKHGVKQLVFSSSAAVYGAQEKVPIKESAPKHPTNPYGHSKLMIEQMLTDLAVADAEWRITMLRYFNPVGAHESGLIGEDPSDVPSNLMPYVAQVAAGLREKVQIFGNDYDTPDGTGVRDYLHVDDLARGHLCALSHPPQSGVGIYNLGAGRGYSVLEMIKAFEKACGHEIGYKVVARRPGDVGACYADASLAEKELDWKVEKTLDEMCTDAWRWQVGNAGKVTQDTATK
jgi:UDP-glucose 4-epimerase